MVLLSFIKDFNVVVMQNQQNVTWDSSTYYTIQPKQTLVAQLGAKPARCSSSWQFSMSGGLKFKVRSVSGLVMCRDERNRFWFFASPQPAASAVAGDHTMRVVRSYGFVTHREVVCVYTNTWPSGCDSLSLENYEICYECFHCRIMSQSIFMKKFALLIIKLITHTNMHSVEITVH